MRFALLSICVAVLLLSLGGAAFAADVPTTLLLPTSVIAKIRQYLAVRPHDEVDAMIVELEQCARVQLPQSGTIVSHGECPEVAAEIARQRKAAEPAAAPAPK